MGASYSWEVESEDLKEIYWRLFQGIQDKEVARGNLIDIAG